MFKIIVNYKILLISIVKNGFLSELLRSMNIESPENLSKETTNQIKDDNQNLIFIDDLLKKSQENGVTIAEIMKMDEIFEKEKEKISPKSRADLIKYKHDVIIDLLNKGIILDRYINDPKGLKKLLHTIQEITGLDFSYRVSKYIKGYRTHHYIANFLRKNEIGISSNQISFLKRDNNNSQSSNLYNPPEIIENEELLYEENREFNTQEYEKAKKFYEKIKPNSSQIRLIQKNIGTTIDGDFGPETYMAIVKYQNKNKLYVDGKAGEDTLAHLGLLKQGETIYDFYNGNDIV